jgi:hypothetical protein
VKSFSVGDPVYYREDPNRVGIVTGVIEPTSAAAAGQTQITVSPPGRKYTTIVYYEDELKICKCANRRPRRSEPCVKSVPF